MAQIVTGFRSIFSIPFVYNWSQRMIGAEKARRILVQDYFPQQDGYRMLDIGCGTAEILRHLPYNIDYYGFDASEAYIRQAKNAFWNRGTFKAELVRSATLNDMQQFDIALAFGLIHHLDDNEAQTLFSIASQALRPGGKLITIDPVYTDEQHPLVRWLISKDRGQNIRTPGAYTELAGSAFNRIQATVRNDMLNIPYSHMIMECYCEDE